MIPTIPILAQADSTAATAAPAAADAAPAAPAPAEGQAITTQPTPQPQADAAQQPEAFGMSSLVTMALIGVLFYFLLIRPQRKQQKEQQERQNSLQAGDKVVTIGGQYGIIREVLTDTVKVEIAPNVVVKFSKAAIAQNQSKK